WPMSRAATAARARRRRSSPSSPRISPGRISTSPALPTRVARARAAPGVRAPCCWNTCCAVPRIDFYVTEAPGAEVRMRLACRIAEKAYLAQQKVVVLLDDGEALRRFD